MEEFIDGQTVWIAGQAHIPPGESPDGLTPYPWSLQGVFATEDDAVAACKGKATWFIGPAIIGECLPDENVLWEGAYWPIGRD